MEKRRNIERTFLLKSTSSCILVCFLILLFSSPTFAQKKRISIGGAQVGGTFYPIAVGMAEVINKYLPEYNAIALETGGTLENIRLLGKKEIDIALANFRDTTLAYKGEKPFTTPIKNLRLGYYLHKSIFHVVTLGGSNIKSMEDLKGKVVSVGAAGSIVAATMEILLRLHNMSIKDLRVRHLGAAESMEAMGDGLIDAAVLYSALPSSAVNSLAAKQKVRLVTADEKVLKAAETNENILCFFVPPKTYKGQDEGAFAWTAVATTYYNEGANIEDVYKWTKVIMEHIDILQKVHPLGKEVRLVTKKELGLSPILLHPGVINYAKEMGISY